MSKNRGTTQSMTGGPDADMEDTDTQAQATREGGNAKYRCPCCGYYTMDEKPYNSYEICPVCFWEADGVQFDDPDYDSGANKLSLNQARLNFARFGASEQEVRLYTRAPKPSEDSGIDWFEA